MNAIDMPGTRTPPTVQMKTKEEPVVQPASAAPTAPVDTGEEVAALLVSGGALTEKQLVHARRVRAKIAGEQSLLSVLDDLGFVKREALQETLRRNQHRIRVGALLVELGHLRPSELDAALQIQKQTGNTRKLGEILVDEHFIDDYRFAEVLSVQLGYQHVEADTAEVDRALLAVGSTKLYRSHSFLPLKRDGDRVVVAFADPLESSHLASAHNVFGHNIVVAITTKRALLDAIGRIEQHGSRTSRAAPADDTTAVGILQNVIRAAMEDGASDIHIEPMKSGLRVRFRRDGILAVYQDYPIAIAPLLATRVKVLCKADIAEKRRHQDGRMLHQDPETGASVDLRVSIYSTIFGEKIVIRILNKGQQLVDIKHMGMAPKMLERFRYDALDLPSGVVIITGPTGSGKTTTLYSGVKYLNNINTSIITAEDPVEFVIDGIGQCSINPKINVTFEETLRHVVRQDPDIIVLGEIRDRFSADTAIQAALTGHKVLTTFHTEDSIGGLLRLMNMNIEAFLISSTVVCVVAQRLLRRVCQHCREPYKATPRDLQRLGWPQSELASCEFVLGRGCQHCRFTGYRGRAGVFELLVLDEVVKEAILERKTSHEIRRISIESSGLVTLLEDGILKAANGITSVQEVVRTLPRIQKARPVAELRRLLGES